MSESATHILLVETLQTWCRRQVDPRKFLEYIDHPQAGPNTKPEVISGFKPDYCLRSLNGKYAYIGEAKTAGDIKNDHTLDQLTMFSKQLIEQGSGHIVIAVPEISKPEMHSILAKVINLTALDFDFFTVISQKDII